MNRISLKKEVSQMSLKDANHAVICVKTTAVAEDHARCMTLFVLPAVTTAKFLSSQETIVLFIVAIAFQANAKSNRSVKRIRRKAYFFVFLYFFAKSVSVMVSTL